jgi:transposase-like protein
VGIVNLGGGLADRDDLSSAGGPRGAGLVGTSAPSYKGFRFPAEIISHCVWLYYRFSLSFRDVEEMMLQRGIVVSHETVRQWEREVRPRLRQRVAPSSTTPW